MLAEFFSVIFFSDACQINAFMKKLSYGKESRSNALGKKSPGQKPPDNKPPVLKPKNKPGACCFLGLVDPSQNSLASTAYFAIILGAYCRAAVVRVAFVLGAFERFPRE